MRRQVRTYLHDQFSGANTASLFTSALAVLLTAVYCWMYIYAFLWVREMLPDASEAEALLNGPSITVRLVFDFVALGVLWRYVTPMRVCRYLQRAFREFGKEVISPPIRAWKRGERLIPALAISLMVSVICSPLIVTAVLIGIQSYHGKPAPRTRPGFADLTLVAIQDSRLIDPCGQSSVLPIGIDEQK